jgi:hypothetical protein
MNFAGSPGFDPGTISIDQTAMTVPPLFSLQSRRSLTDQPAIVQRGQNSAHGLMSFDPLLSTPASVSTQI